MLHTKADFSSTQELLDNHAMTVCSLETTENNTQTHRTPAINVLPQNFHTGYTVFIISATLLSQTVDILYGQHRRCH